MRGLSGPKATAEAKRLATLFSLSTGQVYAISRDVRPARKPRSDRGRKSADIFTNETLRRAAELVALDNLKPDLALEMAEVNTGECAAVSLSTFMRRLREWGLNRRMRRRTSRAYRPFEAVAPMDIFQFDISGVKQRWVDVRTRRIYQLSLLDESRNHPHEHPSHVKLWKFCLIDDHSRRKFVRFVACDKPNSTHCIEFMLEAFRVMGVPRMFYTDRDKIILSERTARAAQLLNRLFAEDAGFRFGDRPDEEQSGFRLDQHKAGNPQATGKAERTHQIVEEFEPLIGLFERQLAQLGERGATLDLLNQFADELCEKVNWTRHRRTGEIPMLRWQRGEQPLRIPPPAVLDSVFTADEFTVPVAGDVTVSFGGGRYQLPRTADFPFREYAEAGRKVKVIRMKGAPAFFIAADDGTLFEIEMVEARPDQAGEFKSLPTAKRARALADLKTSAKERQRSHKEAGTRDLVPGFDLPFRKDEQRPAMFPKPQVKADPARLVEAAPAAAAFVNGNLVDRFQAVALFQREGYFSNPIADEDRDWFIALFGEREEMSDAEIRAALEARVDVRRSA